MTQFTRTKITFSKPGAGLPRGRGALTNRTGRFEPTTREPVDDGWASPLTEAPEPKLRTHVTIEQPRKIITKNQSPDVPFDRSINPYRGCEHGCVYCFARPTHAYMNLSPGLDFESKLFAKPDAAKLLRAELARPSYKPAPLAMGTNTDPYQPVERHFRITRAVLEVLRDTNHPVTIVTKSATILRDLDILAPMAEKGLAKVALSITTLNAKLARAMEPRASMPDKRLDAVKQLTAAGIPTAVMVAPIIPALTDAELEDILKAAKCAGARAAGYVLLRLPLEIEGLFNEWLDTITPDRADRVRSLIRQMRGGKAYESGWRLRQTGRGPYADLIRTRFEKTSKRLGLNIGMTGPGHTLRCDLFTPPDRRTAAAAKPVRAGTDTRAEAMEQLSFF